MTIITYDVKPDNPKYGKTFCQINDDDSIILMDKPFIHSIGFISYAMSHVSASADVKELVNSNDKISKEANTMHDYWAYTFNKFRKGIDSYYKNELYNPKTLWDMESHYRGLYTPPKGKYFMCYAKERISMFITPEVQVLAVVCNNPTFGGKWKYALSEYLNVEELLKKYPEFKKNEEYLQWLEDEMNAGKIKLKNRQVSINQQKLKEFL